MKNKILYLFNNTRSVVLAQKAIIKNMEKCLIIPVPRNISSECGMCIEIEKKSELKIDSILTNTNVVYSKKTDYIY